MIKDIEAIFFDVGTTLRTRVADKELCWQSMRQLTTLLGTEDSPEVVYQRLKERYDLYRQWAQETLIEASEREIWTRWMLPDWPSEQIEPIVEQLADLWHSTEGRRILRPDSRSVVAELANRGYRLGIISNTTNARSAPRSLKEYGLAEYFETVVLSCTFGRRKPDPTIFWEAARRLDVSPAKSAYVGDRPTRDVVGPRWAGFALAIIIDNPRAHKELQTDSVPEPDIMIHKLSELLNIFPPL